MEHPVSALRAKIRSSEDMSGVKFEDSFLLKFLRSREFNVNATYNLLSRYLSVRRAQPQLFVPPSKVRDVFEDDICCVLPRRNSLNGSTVVLIRPGNWDPAKYDVYHVIRASVSLYEQAALSSHTQRHGFESVVDMRRTSTRQLLSVSLEAIKLAADLTEKILPIKFERIHILYQSRAADMVYALARPFLSEDIKRRIVFHGNDLTKFHSMVARQVVPRDLGGTFRAYHARDYYTSQLRRSEDELKRIWSFQTES